MGRRRRARLGQCRWGRSRSACARWLPLPRLPTPGQGAMLARTFGHAPVVFNDALRARQDAHTSGEKISDTQVQRKVVTLAKTTPARQWLGGVASVALVQACQDAHRTG